MSNVWELLNTPRAFCRMHSLVQIAYDAVYTYRAAHIGDTYRYVLCVHMCAARVESRCGLV